MTEGTAIILLVIAELGVVLAIAGIVGAILWTRRKRREQRAVAELITTLTDRQDTRRVTLTGWLTHNLGYPEAEVASRVEQLLEAEMGIYRRMASALHETDAERLAGIMAGMDILTHLYRDTVAAAPRTDAENIAYTTAPADSDEELTKLGEDVPEHGADRPPPPAGAAGTASKDHSADPVFGEDWAPTPQAGEAANAPGDMVQEPAGGDQGGEGGYPGSTAEPATTAIDETRDQATLDAAWEGALAEQAAGIKTDDGATAANRPADSDPLEDLFDDGDDADGEPPVNR